MPVEQSSTFQPIRALLVVAVALAMCVGFIILVLQLRRVEAVEFNLGDDIFQAGDPQNQAEAIRRDGPILYQALQGDRDIWLQHLGEDAERNWYAFDARRPGAARECTLQWQPSGWFVDPCDNTEVLADGTDLPSYPVTIEDDVLLVDLNGVNAGG